MPRPDVDALRARLDAVERAVSGTATADAPTDEPALDELEASVADLETRLAELEATVQALRGFLGGVSAVDETVEQRANLALAKVEKLEATHDDDLAVDRLALDADDAASAAAVDADVATAATTDTAAADESAADTAAGTSLVARLREAL